MCINEFSSTYIRTKKNENNKKKCKEYYTSVYITTTKCEREWCTLERYISDQYIHFIHVLYASENPGRDELKTGKILERRSYKFSWQKFSSLYRCMYK